MHKNFSALRGFAIYEFDNENNYEGGGIGCDELIVWDRHKYPSHMTSIYEDIKNAMFGDGEDFIYHMFGSEIIYYGNSGGDGEIDYMELSLEGNDA